MNLFQSWREERLKSVIPETEIVFSDLTAKTLRPDNLAYSLSAFLNEVKRQDGAEFGAKGLYNLVIMLQFFLEKKGLKWKLCEDDPFLHVRYTLDNLMKKRCADRVSVTKSSVPLTYSDEEKCGQMVVWVKTSPQSSTTPSCFCWVCHAHYAVGKNTEI